MFDYKEFKEKVARREFHYRNDGYSRVISFISEVYKEENILAFYFKNAVNEKPKELLFIFKDGILRVSQVEEKDFIYEHYSTKVVKKKLLTSKYTQQIHELTVTLESGEVIEFNNIEDSNSDWSEEYTRFIKEVYKSI